MWKTNDQPREGLMQMEGEVRSDKMAESILNNCTGTFWKEAKKIRPKKVF